MSLMEELTKIVGDGGVSDSQDDIAALIKGQSLEPSRIPEVMVSVKASDEVGKVIQLANDQNASVTLSSSSEHSRGITPCDGGILLDLSKMKNIEAPDNRNRKVKVEAGVTWAEVGEVLKKEKLMINNPFLPRANSSVLTSVLERDPMLNAQFEFGERIMSLEMFWPTGELFRTGSASSIHYGKGSLASGCYPYGPGPLDPMRLLENAQGTMGVCTWTNLKTELLPEVDKAFLIPFDKLEDLAEALYIIQLKKLGKECVVLNSQNLATILEKQDIKGSLPPWSILIVLPGGRLFPEEKIAYEEEALNEVQAGVFSSAKLLEEIPGAGSTDILPGLLRNPWPADKTYWKDQPKGACQDLFFI
ncbi:MAG: FAD-binding oxidoreductase, partial [Desulfobacterales bacterium]|nr:FAD-binding oxidoreductase [Desulfobacterales bacterium]